jgi:WXG100 family type VII secretion target
MANVNVTFQEMEAAATRLSVGRGEIEGQLGGLQRQVETLVSSGYVTDSSSGAFLEAYNAFTAGCLQAVQGLDAMSSYLNAAAGTFRDADQQLASAARR